MDDWGSVADAVHGLAFPPAPPGCQKRWREQIETAIDQQIRHEAAQHDREDALAKHYAQLRRHPAWRDKKKGRPEGHPDWVFGMWFGADDNKPLEGWGPRKLVQPVRPGPAIPTGLDEADNAPPSEYFPGQYMVLAIVHDVADKQNQMGRPRLLEGLKLPTALQVCLNYIGRLKGLAGFGAEAIERALTCVKADLAAASEADGAGGVGQYRRRRGAKGRPYRPLPRKALAVLELLQGLSPNKGMTGTEIVEHFTEKDPPLFFDQSTLTSRIVPKLKAHGLRNRRGVGYYIDPVSAAKARH